jgi:hypothetical protein
MTKEFYTDWANRLNSLETARDATLAIHFGAVGYFLKEAISQNSIVFQSGFHTFSWIAFTSLFSYVLCRLALNRYLKSIRSASELMIIEYYSELPKKGLGYYSFRLTDKREGFILLGIVPEILSVGYLVSILLILVNSKQFLLASLCFCGVVFFTHLSLKTNQKIKSAIAKKDKLESILRRSWNEGYHDLALLENEVCQFRMAPEGDDIAKAQKSDTSQVEKNLY